MLVLSGALAFAVPTGAAPAQATPAQATAATAASTGAAATPAPPAVDDPLLVPAPRPARVLSSWDEALALLRARSTDLRIAMDQVLTAEAQTRTALAAYLPSINGTGTYTHNFLTGASTQTPVIGGPGGSAAASAVAGLVNGANIGVAGDTLSGSLVARQAIINVQAFDQISIDELNEDAQRLSVDDEKRTLLLSVANQIVAVVTAERQADINRVGLRVALEQQDISTRKQALGAANGLDVVRARQNTANARATLVTGDETLREAREALGLALGVPEETGVQPDINIDGMAGAAMASCRAAASVDERADVAAARVSLQVAKRNLRNVYFQFLPSLSAASTLNTTNQNVLSQPKTTWNIQGILTVPIWDGGARYGALRSARAAEDVAAQQLEAARRQAIIQVQQAQRQLVVAQQSAGVAREQRDLAAQNDAMTQAAYLAGQGTSLELVTASEAHRQAELNLTLVELNAVKARILAALALASCPW